MQVAVAADICKSHDMKGGSPGDPYSVSGLSALHIGIKCNFEFSGVRRCLRSVKSVLYLEKDLPTSTLTRGANMNDETYVTVKLGISKS